MHRVTNSGRRAGFAAFLLGLGLTAPSGRAVGQATGSVAVTVTSAGLSESQPLHVIVALTTADVAAKLVRSDSADDRHTITLTAVPAGRYRVESRVIGFSPETSFVDVIGGQTASVTLNMERVTSLPTVDIAGTGKGHLLDFERRRAAGKGTFITRDDIVAGRQSQIAGVLKNVRGLRIECQMTCTAQMVRSTNCEPRYFINGFPTDSQILMTPVLDVAGIEIYRGPSETPGEFMGGNSMCGAIVIWTK